MVHFGVECTARTGESKTLLAAGNYDIFVGFIPMMEHDRNEPHKDVS